MNHPYRHIPKSFLRVRVIATFGALAAAAATIMALREKLKRK